MEFSSSQDHPPSLNDGSATGGRRPLVRHHTRTLIIAFLIMNIAVGLTYGSFGPLVSTIAIKFDARLSLVSLCMSLVVLNSGLQGILIGFLVGRCSLRRIMAAGALLAAAGYAGLAVANDIYQLLFCYGLLIGPGVALLGTLPCLTLVSNWFGEGRGRAIGIINMPVMIMVAPVTIAALLPRLEFSQMMLILAAGYLLALPLVALVIDHPPSDRPTPRIDQSPTRDESVSPSISVSALVRDPTFLLIVLGAGLIAGAGASKTVHYFKLLSEIGLGPGRAALLMSISSGAGTVGSIIFGAIADRFNAGKIIMANACIQAAVWFILIIPVSFGMLVMDAVLIGICVSGFIASLSVLLARIYGSANFARVMGAMSLALIPFLFCLAPLAGLAREMSGTYVAPVLMHIAGFAVAGACFFIVGKREQSRPRNIGL